MVWPQQRLGRPPDGSLPEGYTLRTFRPGDAAEHIRLMHSAGFVSWNEEQLAGAMDKCLPNGFFVVEHNTSGPFDRLRAGRLVATAMAHHQPLPHHPCGGELGWVAGDHEHKGKGLGYAVCAAATRRLIEIGYRNIYLRTDDFRLAAIKVYLKLGYVPFLFAPDMEGRWHAVCAKLSVDFEKTFSVRVPFAEPRPSRAPWEQAFNLNAETAGLALDTILGQRTRGIPSWLIHPMEHAVIERLAGYPAGAYRSAPAVVYLAMQNAAGTCLLDQWIPENPLTMGDKGFEGAGRGATTGAHEVVLDGMAIVSPEDVVEHMEKLVFPGLRRAVAEFNEDERVRNILESERAVQAVLRPNILKSGYAFVSFPGFDYGDYGYANYFMACALYPNVIESHFSLQADLALLNNRAAARAYREGNLPPLYRLDHDMADSRGTLVDIRLLDRIWFPHFARALEPLLKTDVRMIWHCDGNLMQMVPRLLEAGVRGFQGFQYEDGMDYEKICRMKAKDGSDLIIIAGVSVTRTLPNGRPADVKREMEWLVKNGPKTGLFLGGSSSIAPGVPWENVATLVEGLKHYRDHGRGN
jgi:mycothiol synthase